MNLLWKVFCYNFALKLKLNNNTKVYDLVTTTIKTTEQN